MSSSENIRGRYSGCMLGAAIGDAIGKQNEGINRKDIVRKVTDFGKAPKGCPGEKLGAGQYTDDTEQMLVLARSLIVCGGFNVSDFSLRIARWGSLTLSDPARRSLIGPSSRVAVERLMGGASWEESGSDIPSCGSAMRAAPLGLFYEDLDELESMAALSSLPTHRSSSAIGGAVAVAVGVMCALDGDNTVIKEVCARTSKYDDVLAGKIRLAFKKREEEPDTVFEELGTSYLVHETVPCAFYCFSRHSGSPENTVTEAVNAGGDTDSIACIAGALCGARNGVGSFPARWLAGIENRDEIERVAGMLFEGSQRKKEGRSNI